MTAFRRLSVAVTLFVALALTALGHPAQAAVVFNNFGPGDTYATTIGWGVGAFSIPAMYFDTPTTSNYTFDGLDLAAFTPNGSHGLVATLMTDSGGQPGSALESLSVFPSPVPTIVSASSTLHPILTAGDRYWLALLPGDAATVAGWDFAVSDARPFVASFDSEATWTPQTPAPGQYDGVFRIYGTPQAVPEPAFYQLGALLALGGLGLVRMRKRA